MAPRNGVRRRLSRDEWLAQALDILATEGQAKLRVETICAALGVTKGSFYWHFKDRDEFVRGLARYWSDYFTDPVIAQVTQSANDAGERLEVLMYAVSDGGLARYDVSIRAWAAQDPDLVAALVRSVDERRLDFVGSIFAELGFEGDEIGMRARACIAYLSFESSFLVKSEDGERRKMLDAFLEMITRE